MALRQKALSALQWSFADSSISQLVEFFVAIILARLLSPREFGLIGMITFFIAVSNSFMDSGFSEALVRKQDCTEEDFNTVFYYNLAAGMLLYLALFFSANAIGYFYHEPALPSLVRVLGLNIIIGSFGVIQRAILVKHINFKLQTKVTVVASVASGILSIALAKSGFGVWSLVWKSIAFTGISITLLWLWSVWRPSIVFSMQSAREMFGFGSKLMASGLLNTIFTNIYYLVIGKFFSPAELGYFTKAEQFQETPSKNMYGIIQRVSYPVLASIRDDPPRMKRAFISFLRNVMFVSFVLMAGLAAVARPLIVTLIGEKWAPVIPYLQLLCFSGALFPLHGLNLSILKIEGRSDLFLRLEIIKKALVVPVLVIGLLYGIEVMIVGITFNSVFSYFINSYWTGKFIGYPMKQQVVDILPSFCLAAAMGTIVWVSGLWMTFQPAVALAIEVILGAGIVIVISELFRLGPYLETKGIIRGYIVNAASRIRR